MRDLIVSAVRAVVVVLAFVLTGVERLLGCVTDALMRVEEWVYRQHTVAWAEREAEE
jgi:hypothetical protein